MNLRNIISGKNSVLYDSHLTSILYEKLSNTVHSDQRKKLSALQEKVERVEYRPYFETESLKKEKEKPLNMILLEITENCNFRCSYCIYSGNYINERRASSKRMSFKTAKKAMDELINLSKESSLIGFYGGEPLLNMDLIKEVIDYAKISFPSKEFTFSMTSNFFEADKHISYIVGKNMYINISLDGPKEVHDKYRKTKKGEPTYEKIISNLKKFENYSPGYGDSHFFIIPTCNNPNDLERIVHFFKENNLFVSHIGGVEFKGKVSNEKFSLDNPDNAHLTEEYLQMIQKGEDPKILRRLFDNDLKAIAFRDNQIMPQELILNGSCYPGKKRIFVDINGDYYPCERLGSRLSIGSIKKGLQLKLINNAVEDLANIRNNLCKDCWAQRLCSPCLQHAKDPLNEISIEGLSQTCEGKKSKLIMALNQYSVLMKSNKDQAEKYFKSINPLFERG